MEFPIALFGLYDAGLRSMSTKSSLNPFLSLFSDSELNWNVNSVHISDRCIAREIHSKRELVKPLPIISPNLKR